MKRVILLTEQKVKVGKFRTKSKKSHARTNMDLLLRCLESV
jgi:hypothetical protein